MILAQVPRMRTQVYRLSVNELGDQVRGGEWRLPRYQRGLVWEPAQCLRLVESVYEGYPVGALLLWERSWQDVVILDGQQRLAALTGLRPGTDEAAPTVGWSFETGRWALEPASTTDALATLTEWQSGNRQGIFHDHPEWMENYGKTAFYAALKALDRLMFNIVPINVLKEATPAQAIEGFRRVNVEGTSFDQDDLAKLLEAESFPRHWLLFATGMDEPIGCTQGVETAKDAIRQALPEKEWGIHEAHEIDPDRCPNCKEP